MINSVIPEKKNICIVYKMADLNNSRIEFRIDESKNANKLVFNPIRNRMTRNRVRVKFGSKVHLEGLRRKREIKYADRYRAYRPSAYSKELLDNVLKLETEEDQITGNTIYKNPKKLLEENEIFIDLYPAPLFNEEADPNETEETLLIKKSMLYYPTYNLKNVKEEFIFLPNSVPDDLEGSNIEEQETIFKLSIGLYRNLIADYETNTRLKIQSRSYNFTSIVQEGELINFSENYTTKASEEIKLNEDKRIIVAKIFKHIKDLRYSGDSDAWINFLLSCRVVGFPLDENVGCACRESRGAFNGMYICNPKSKDNNCLIACFMKGLGIKGNKNITNKIRLYIDEVGDKKIPVEKIDKICKYFKDNYNKNTTVKIYEVGADDYSLVYGDGDITLNFLKMGDHMSLIENLDYKSKHCKICNTWYYKNHTCNPTKVSFLQKKILKSSLITSGEVPKCMTCKSYKNKEGFTGNKTIVYDIETFGNPHIPYAVGWYDTFIKKYFVSYGENCYKKFIEYLKTIDGYNVVAYNGSNFDNHFTLKELLKEENKTDIENIILKDGKLMKFFMKYKKSDEEIKEIRKEIYSYNKNLVKKYYEKNPEELKFFKENNKHPIKLYKSLKKVNEYNKNYFTDLCLFLNTSLKKACKSFKVNTQKGEFNHNKINSWEDVETHKEECLEYLRKDVIGLGELYEVFGNTINDIFSDIGNFNIDKFLTISQLAYEVWTTTVKDVVNIPNEEEYDFIGGSIYGGRTHPVKRFYQSSQYEDIKSGKIKHKDLKDYIYIADVKSLYPTAMKFSYPVGASRKVKGDEECRNHKKLGIFKIKYITNKKLPISILPRKSDKGGVIWDLKDGEGTYNSIDIQNAIDMGYKVEYIEGIVWDKVSNVFSEYVDRIYKLKLKAEKEGNEVQRSIAKLLLNALYGKTIQRAIFDNSIIVNNKQEARKFFEDYKWSDFVDLGNKLIMSGQALDKTSSITKPIQLGSFVLGYSRKIMLDYTVKIVPTIKDDLRKSMEDMWYYTDTDCLHIKSNQMENIKDDMGDSLGCMDNDIDNGGLVIKSYYIAPKLYACEYIDKDNNIKYKLRGKGCPNNVLNFEIYRKNYEDNKTTTINFESAFKKCRFSSQIIKNGIKSEKVSATNLSYLDIFKESMSRTIGKTLWAGRKYLDNKIDTIPHYAEF